MSSLSRPFIGNRYGPWGAIKTAILAAISFGILPLLLWPRRFADFASVEQQQLWQLAEWLRLRTGRPEAIRLRDSTMALAPRSRSWIFAMVLAVVAAGWLIVPSAPAITLTRVLSVSYGYVYYMVVGGDAGLTRSLVPTAYHFWIGLLGYGYFCHWLVVCQRSGLLQRFVRDFNVLAELEHVGKIQSKSVGVGFSPVWIVVAFLFSKNNAYWAIPMAFAGVVQYRYIMQVSRSTRAQLSGRVRELLVEQRPALRVSEPVTRSGLEGARSCSNERCLALLPATAAFCPRCGAVGRR